MFGSIIPAPLTTPPIVMSPTDAGILTEHDLVHVSEVRIASWKAFAPSYSLLMSSAALRMPAVILLIGRGSPIRPVEQTKTSCEWILK